MDKIIVEVGSTCTKVDKFNEKTIEKLEGKTIQFKKHYNEDKKLRESDINELINSIKELKSISEDIYVCGTSIFRSLNDLEKISFLERFKNETGYNFNIISQEKENELTVFGTTRFVNNKVCVFIGGGGSTEIAIYDKGIKESVNTQIGVIDVMQKFPDLAEDIATTNLETVKTFIKERLNLPKEKADILILAGGGHEKFARFSGIKYEENTLYNDEASPIMMDIETRKSETERYYKEISLDEIRSRVNDPDWWYATRAMSAFALVVAEAIGAKYIVPTDIAMVYGILDKVEI
jgi:exopolyphosphatase/pppGpp-phosphohydrolase